MADGFFKNCWALIRPYWKSNERWLARGLLAVIIALNLGEVYISVLFNSWNNDFYNALQAMDKHACSAALVYFCWLAFFYILVAVYKTYLNQMLRIKWRRWMTGHMLARWMEHRHYYRMQLMGTPTDNPDQRIAEDIEQFIQLALTLSLGMLSSVVTLCSFLFILWKLSGPADFMLLGVQWHVPGYMLWAALFYAVFGTWITFIIGRPLIGLNYNQQRFEADFRFALVRVRENTESIAFYRGEAQEEATLRTRFTQVVDNFWAIMKRQKTLNWFTSFYGQAAIVFPFFVALPRYFAKEIQLGGLMQTASAFGQVQNALSYIIDSYTSIATWRAVTQRLSGFNHSMAVVEAASNAPLALTRDTNAQTMLTIENLSLHKPDGSVLLEPINLSVAPSSSLLITGASGVGKSTLLRALAGLWPYAAGSVHVANGASMLFLPQKPYLPLGTLRQVVCYPAAAYDEADIQSALTQCGLHALLDRLDSAENWAMELSLGEQQRIAFARILLTRPDIVCLDEATSALDEAAEAQLYALVKAQLPRTALVSVGHRPTLKAWHDNTLELGYTTKQQREE